MSPARRTACDSCSTRKILCDTPTLGDPCNWCLHHNLACTFNRPSRATSSSRRPKNKKKGTGDIAKRLELLEARIAQVHGLHHPRSTAETSDHSQFSALRDDSRYIDDHGQVFPAKATPESESPASSTPDNRNPQGQLYFWSYNFGTLCTPSGLPVFTERCKKWLRDVTGEWPCFEGLTDHEVASPYSPSQHAAPAEPALPDPRILESVVEAYQASDFGRTFPFVDGLLFRDTMRLAYTDCAGSDTPAHISARACALAIWSIGSLQQKNYPMGLAEGLELGNAELCLRQAEQLLSQIPTDSSLPTLQATMTLLLWKAHVGDTAGARVHHAMACRIVFALGGHTRVADLPQDRTPCLQERHDHNVRCLFWLCYTFDKDFALQTALPPIIGDDYCDLTLPHGYVELVYSNRRESLRDHKIPMPWLISDLRLSQLRSKVLNQLYSFTSAKKSDAELILTIRELDEELERWRLTIPTEFAPTLAIRHGVKLGEHLLQSEKMLHIEIHLAYHHLLSVIHWASGRCARDQSNAARDVYFGLQSSMEISVEASRSTLIYLSIAIHHLAGEAFWFFTFYPISAFLSLFFNLVRRPGNEYAEVDLELLRTASEVLRKIPKSDSTPKKTAYLARLDQFFEELIRLACYAVQGQEKN